MDGAENITTEEGGEAWHVAALVCGGRAWGAGETALSSRYRVANALGERHFTHCCGVLSRGMQHAHTLALCSILFLLLAWAGRSVPIEKHSMG